MSGNEALIYGSAMSRFSNCAFGVVELAAKVEVALHDVIIRHSRIASDYEKSPRELREMNRA